MSRHIAIAALALALLASSTAVRAQDCPRGDLDTAYCDRDGDMAADTPTDAKQLVNPSVLVFAYTPVEDPAVYGKVWDGFIKHMEKATGKKVVFFPVQSSAAEVMFRMFDRMVVDKAKIRTNNKTKSFPTTGYGYAHNLDPALGAKIK